ncbi:MAG TPA: FtsX-like permease family protein [Bryobacteraceae bacterium]|jgi:ABC-type antimicrobial peptide transport system permease subunit|nr:FtsX-like permease family protein [Bryobacteraceae bacterium]
MQHVIADKLWRSRVSAMLLGCFAAIALALAAVGTYGVIFYGVRERTREIGIRVALGGTRLDMAVGVALGIAAALLASRLIAELLYQVRPVDMTTYSYAVLVLMLTSILATCVPAWRAMRADPLQALHHD